MMVMVVGETKPFRDKSKNWLELFNEFSTLIVNYHLMMFTDFVPDLNTREQIGQSLVYCTAGNLVINLVLVGSSSIGMMIAKFRLKF